MAGPRKTTRPRQCARPVVARPPRSRVCRAESVIGRSEQEGVLCAQGVQSIGAHHPAVGPTPVCAPSEVRELQAEDAEPAGQGLQHLLPGRYHILAHAIPGDGGDAVNLHVRFRAKVDVQGRACSVARAGVKMELHKLLGLPAP